ncbi:MAG: tetratricopeptide repeat protein [Desulfobacterales bacterium]|nr:tetratricopeptide repeat protein [Desulfobacterales bacterium]
MKPEQQTPPALRYALCAMVLSLSLGAFYALYPRFISQIYFTKARRFLKDGHPRLALNNYQKAVAYQPRDIMARKGLAGVLFDIEIKETSVQEVFYYTQKARNEYVHASFYNPIDAETAYGLARAENRLEQLYQYLHPEEKNNPYNALPYFEKAIRLRPNSTTFHYAMARYLYRHGDQDALLKTVRAMARIYPEAYTYLKKEPLWSPSVKAAVKQGFMDAIKQEMLIERAHRAMSTMLAEDNEWDNAIFYYQKALEFKKDNISAEEYTHLGRLFLQNNQIKEAQLNFIKGLYVSPSVEKTFSDIGRIFKDTHRIDEFFAFYQETNARFLFSPKMHITSARYLMDLKQYLRAQRILTGLNRETPTAEAYYWLARIDEIDKDFDAMELHIQKATVLDPSNMNYRRMFYGLLNRLGKHETAEREIGLMIQNSENPSPQLFDERAKLRRNRNDYTGAVEDWKTAIGLAPKNAAFYANIAEAYMKLGNLPQALEYYKKAAQLDPENQSYAGKYKKLRGESL